MKRKLSALAVAGTVGLVGLGGAGAVSAFSGPSDTEGTFPDRLAERFNLDKTQVQAAFNEERGARMAQLQEMFSQRLQTAVDDGDLTAEQKKQIETKLQERQDAREKQHDELEQWAEDNGIDITYIMGGRHGMNDDRLQAAVDSGDITPDQKKLIEEKQTELRDAHEAQRDELRQWAEDNGIDQQFLMGGFGGGMHRGLGGRH